MPPKQTLARAGRRALEAAALSAALTAPAAPAGAEPVAGPAVAGAPALKPLFDAAWAQQPEARALQARRAAAEAQRRAASRGLPEAPALEAAHKTDRLTGREGARELEVGLALPLWLPGEQDRAGALAEAEAAAVESQLAAARLRLAASVREAWWAWQQARMDEAMGRAQLDSARQLARDVARRTRAGELARADQHQAEGAVAAAEARLAQAEAGATAAWLRLQALGGTGLDGAGAPAAEPQAEPEPASPDALPHPALTALQDRATVAERTAALAARRSRAHPELSLSTTRDRGAAGERYGQTLNLALRLPLDDGPRHDRRVATALAEAAEAQARLELDRARLAAEREAARARVDAARRQQAAAERRAALAGETRGFFEKSFRLGETDLPTRLRIEAEAAEAERQAVRSRLELAAAISAWRQALGLLPQ